MRLLLLLILVALAGCTTQRLNLPKPPPVEYSP